MGKAEHIIEDSRKAIFRELLGGKECFIEDSRKAIFRELVGGGRQNALLKIAAKQGLMTLDTLF